MTFLPVRETFTSLLIACFIVILTISCTSRGPVNPGPEDIRVWKKETNQGLPMIRVLLNKPTGKKRVELTSNGRMRLQHLDRPDVTRTVRAGKTVTFVRRGDQLVVDGRSFSQPGGFQIRTGDSGILKTENRSYRGRFRIYLNDRSPEGADEGGLLVVNHVPINKYLWSVLGGELLPNWTGDHINRTQAVAARTYTLYEMKKRAEERHERFDVYDSQRSQVYAGIQRERPATKEGVEDTIGELMIYGQDQLVPTYFSSTCGGHTSPPRPNFSWYDGPPVPAPLKGVSCPWDDVSKHHRWEAQVSGSALKQALFPGGGANSVYDMVVQERISEGRAETIAFRLSSGSIKKMSGPAFRMAMARYRSTLEGESQKDRAWIRSTKFRVKKGQNGVFLFRGKGWGHGVGLCQYGAFGATQDGYGYREILRHYYQSASVEQHYPVQQ